MLRCGHELLERLGSPREVRVVDVFVECFFLNVVSRALGFRVLGCFGAFGV